MALSMPHKKRESLQEKGCPYFQTQDSPSLGLQAATANHARAPAKESHTTTPLLLKSAAKNCSFSFGF